MKDDIVPSVLLTIFVLGVCAILILLSIGEYNGQKAYYKNCITYHENLSVVEANKMCTAILKGTTK